MSDPFYGQLTSNLDYTKIKQRFVQRVFLLSYFNNYQTAEGLNKETNELLFYTQPKKDQQLKYSELCRTMVSIRSPFCFASAFTSLISLKPHEAFLCKNSKISSEFFCQGHQCFANLLPLRVN